MVSKQKVGVANVVLPTMEVMPEGAVKEVSAVEVSLVRGPAPVPKPVLVFHVTEVKPVGVQAAGGSSEMTAMPLNGPEFPRCILKTSRRGGSSEEGATAWGIAGVGDGSAVRRSSHGSIRLYSGGAASEELLGGVGAVTGAERRRPVAYGGVLEWMLPLPWYPRRGLLWW
uniref:Uncharacterized protein n=1 Tax=Arundo donax TaxID=35708 RepID=A0A0A9CH74_ARUDO